MFKSIKHFAKLCVLRGNPADVDGRTHTLVILFLILLVLDPIIVLTALGGTASNSFTSVQSIGDDIILRVLSKICTHLLVALFIYATFHVRNVRQNFRQTYSSYLGVSIIITLVSSVVIVATVFLSAIGDLDAFYDRRLGFVLATGLVFFVVALVYLVSTVWKIFTFGYILVKSMEIKFWQGGIVAIMFIYAPEGLLVSLPELFGFVRTAIGYVSGVGFF